MMFAQMWFMAGRRVSPVGIKHWCDYGSVAALLCFLTPLNQFSSSCTNSAPLHAKPRLAAFHTQACLRVLFPPDTRLPFLYEFPTEPQSYRHVPLWCEGFCYKAVVSAAVPRGTVCPVSRESLPMPWASRETS